MSYEPALGMHVSRFLNHLHDLMWTIESDSMDTHIRYTEEDVMHALKVYMHVAGNVAINRYRESGSMGPEAHRKHVKMAKKLRDFNLEFTGYDPHAFYRKSQ